MRQKHTSCIKNIKRIHLPFVRSKVSSMALPQKYMYLPLKLLQRRKINICIFWSLNYNSRRLTLLLKFDMAFKTIFIHYKIHIAVIQERTVNNYGKGQIKEAQVTILVSFGKDEDRYKESETEFDG